MKITNKDTTPLSPSILLRRNKAIVHNESSNDDQVNLSDEIGRHVKYEPTLIVTPVMTSDRTKRNSANRPRLSKGAVNEVCTMLNILFLKESTNEDVKAIPEVPVIKHESLVDNELVKAESHLGRVSISVMSPKTKAPVMVHRSARLTLIG